MGVSFSKVDQGGEEIPTISLNDILKGKSNVLLKCDIEGGELEVFTEDTDLSNVNRIAMEYHLGCGKDMAVLLERKGFKVKANWAAESEGRGLIYASRKKD